jgi:hypothetical protein
VDDDSEIRAVAPRPAYADIKPLTARLEESDVQLAASRSQNKLTSCVRCV